MIAIIISANTEWKTVISHYAIKELERTPFGECFAIKIREEIVRFFHGGWGKIDAAASAQYIIDAYHPELIINIGTCGGFEGSIQAGEILLAEKTIVYDIYERMSDPQQAQLAYTTEIDTSWIAESPNMPVVRATLISADQDLDPGQIATLQTKFLAKAGDWESGAIAHVCKRNNTAVLIARGVSDLINSDNGEAYQSKDIFIRRTKKIMPVLLGLLPSWITMYRNKMV